MFAFGLWFQTGVLSTPTDITENGALGFYLFGSQRVWFKNPEVDNSGISIFYQLGFNNSITLPFPEYIGFGFTGFGLIKDRPEDSMGTGLALASLNKNLFTHATECMLQFYYQLHLIKSSFFIATLSYIPNPGIPASKRNAVALTGRIIALF